MTGKPQEDALFEEAELYWLDAQQDAVRRQHMKALLVALSATANNLLEAAQKAADEAVRMRELAEANHDLAKQAMDMAEELAKAIAR